MSWPVSLLQSMSLVVLSGFARAGSEVVGGDQGVGVVVAQDPAHGGEGVFAELASSGAVVRAVGVTGLPANVY